VSARLHPDLADAHPGRREIRPHVGAALAASCAYELRLEIRQPNIIRPSVTADRDVMGALVIGAIDQEPAHPGAAHFSEDDFLLVHTGTKRPGLGRGFDARER